MSMFSRIAMALLIVGGLNWGLIGFFQYDLVASLFGGQAALLSRVVYGLVGISALACLGLLFKPSEERDTSSDRSFVSHHVSTEFGEEPDFKEEKDFK